MSLLSLWPRVRVHATYNSSLTSLFVLLFTSCEIHHPNAPAVGISSLPPASTFPFPSHFTERTVIEIVDDDQRRTKRNDRLGRNDRLQIRNDERDEMTITKSFSPLAIISLPSSVIKLCGAKSSLICKETLAAIDGMGHEIKWTNCSCSHGNSALL